MASGTTFPRKADIRRDWYVVDASGQTLGRLASRIARVLSGKHKPEFTPFLDTGDFVVVVNAERIRLTGTKATSKLYRRHSGYPGGLKTESAGHLMARRPERIIEEAVRGMLPKGRLGRRQLKKLKVYRGGKHPHAAQRPRTLTLPAPAARA
jgi:large subunit ribosomal protein L13